MFLCIGINDNAKFKEAKSGLHPQVFKNRVNKVIQQIKVNLTGGSSDFFIQAV